MTHFDDQRETIGKRTTRPTRSHAAWKQGDLCRVDGWYISRESGRLYDARILALSTDDDDERGAGGVQMAELHVTASVKGFDGLPVQQAWTHAKPVPTAKLRKALLT